MQWFLKNPIAKHVLIICTGYFLIMYVNPLTGFLLYQTKLVTFNYRRWYFNSFIFWYAADTARFELCYWRRKFVMEEISTSLWFFLCAGARICRTFTMQARRTVPFFSVDRNIAISISSPERMRSVTRILQGYLLRIMNFQKFVSIQHLKVLNFTINS